jgi:hypothetical protein
MSFSLVTTEEKLKNLNAAKADFQVEIYKNLTKLGFNPDTYNVAAWNFDPASSSEVADSEYRLKCSITTALERIVHIDAKIAELS